MAERAHWRPRNADPHASTRVDILKSAGQGVPSAASAITARRCEQIAAALHMKKRQSLLLLQEQGTDSLFACHQYSLDRLLRLLEEIERGSAAADVKLRRLIVAFVHTMIDELCTAPALFLDLEALSPAHLKTVIARRDHARIAASAACVRSAGWRTARSRRPTPSSLTFALLGAVNWIPRWVQPGRPRQLADHRRSLRRFYLIMRPQTIILRFPRVLR